MNDSKKLTEAQREELYAEIIATPGVLYAVSVLLSCGAEFFNDLWMYRCSGFIDCQALGCRFLGCEAFVCRNGMQVICN